MVRTSLTLLSVSAVLGSFAQPPIGSPWAMEGKDAKHTGRTTYTPQVGGGTPGTARWTFFTGDSSEELMASAVIGPEGNIYFGSERPNGDGGVYCVSSSGALVWSATIPRVNSTIRGFVQAPPALGLLPQNDEGTMPPYGVFVVSFDQRVHCYSCTTGAMLWRSKDLGNYLTSSPVIGPSGKLYVSTNPGNIYCFNAAGSGTEQNYLWSYKPPGSDGFDAAVSITGTGSATRLWACSVNGHIYRMKDPPDSTTEAFAVTSGVPTINCWPLIGDDGTVYVTTLGNGTSYQGYCYAIKYDVTNGFSYKWLDNSTTPHHRVEYMHMGTVPDSTSNFGMSEGCPCLGPSGEILFGTQMLDGVASFLKVTDLGVTGGGRGDVLSQSNVGYFDPIAATAISTATGAPCAVFANEDGHVWVTSLTGDLTTEWPFISGYHCEHPNLAIASDGTIYLGTSVGRLIAIWGPN